MVLTPGFHGTEGGVKLSGKTNRFYLLLIILPCSPNLCKSILGHSLLYAILLPMLAMSAGPGL